MADGFNVTFQTPKQIAQEEEKKAKALTPIIPKSAHEGLSGYFKSCWTDAVDAKREIQTVMLSCAKRLKGEYEEDKLAAIRSVLSGGGSEAYIRAVNTKCRAAYNNIYDIYNSLNEPSWSIQPSPIPELPADLQMAVIARVQQEIMLSEVSLDETQIAELDDRAQKEIKQAVNDDAKARSERMTLRIRDELVDGKWQETLNQFLNDLVIYPAAIMKGPILRKEPRKTWIKDDFGKSKCVVKDKLIWDYERVSPPDFYPERNIENINDGYCFHRLRLNRRKVERMKGLKGYNDEEINKVLSENTTGSLSNSWLSIEDSKADEAEDRDLMQSSPEGRIDGLEFWGSVSGKMLREWGMSEKDIPDETKEYDITAILIGSHVIRAVLNRNPLGKKPFHKESWEKIEGQFWGNGIPQKAAGIEDILNAAVRALANNLAISSGPQIAVDISQLAVGQDANDQRPLKVWLLDSTQNLGGLSGNSRLPIEFFSPPSYVNENLAVIKACMDLLDEYTGIPSITYGIAQNEAAGKTASGQQMQLSMAGKNISNVSSRVDRYVIESSIGMIYDMLMLYDPDESIKGDAEIVAGGAKSVIAKQQQLIRLMELMDRTNNDVDMQIIGLPGRAKMLKNVFHRYDLDLDDVIPDQEELKRRDEIMQKLAQQEKMAQTANLTPAQPQNLDSAGTPVAGTDTAQFMPLQGSNTQ
jgi:hypothetical protein